MQLRHVKTILPQQDGLNNKVLCMSWSTNNQRLAVGTADRLISLFDEAGERRDKFATKPADKSTRTYAVAGVAWSPDSSRLAVAQTDNILFVYRLGLEWTDKKSICNKFPASSAITCVAWPSGLHNEVVFGTAEGKVRQGSCRANKAATLYSADSYVTAVAHGPDGRSVIAGHADGSIYRIMWDESGNNPGHSRLASHPCPPFALGWGAAVVAAGSDGRVCFYDAADGSLTRTFERSREGGGPTDWSCACVSPSGEAVVLGTYGGPALFALGSATTSDGRDGGYGRSRFGAASSINREWMEVSVPSVPVAGLHSVTCVSWKPDGSKVAVGAAGGSGDLWDACLRRTRYKDRFEFTYVSLSSVIVKRLSTGVRIVLRSSFGHEIVRVRVVKGGGEKFIAAYTPATLLVGDLESCRLSEVPWSGPPQAGPSSTERNRAGSVDRFFFDVHPSVALIARAGEVTVVEYGKTEALATVRTEHASRHSLSVRLVAGVEGGPRPRPALKRMAYLVDGATLRVLDLATGNSVASVQHDARIEWLQLSHSGRLVIFKDKRRRLLLVDLGGEGESETAMGMQRGDALQARGTIRVTLLPYASYAAWVPGTDVIVAQRRSQLCAWYNPRRPDAMSTWDIRGSVEGVVRDGPRVEVLVDEGLTQAAYALDGALIGFAAAVEAGDLAGAAGMLESLPSAQGIGLSGEHAALWSQLGKEALVGADLAVAQRAAVAVGDTARARFLGQTLKIARLAGEKLGGDGRDHWMVRARLAQLRGDIAAAEAIFLAAGRLEDAIEMHQSLHRYEDAIALAEAHGRPGATDMRKQFTSYLLQSGQEERAGAMKETEGDASGAIALYLKGGCPARALSVVLSSPKTAVSRDIQDKIVSALASNGLFDKAGQLLDRLGDSVRAMEAYVRGKAYRQAVDLARRSFPARVIELEKGWGEHLVSIGNPEAAIHHFNEAGAYAEAINAALDARQWLKAAQLVQDTMANNPEAARPAWRRLARHHADRGALEEAEKCFLRAGEGRAAVDMYVAAGKHDAAYRVARSVMPDGEVVSLFVSTAQRMESSGALRAAERLFVTVRAFDAAIGMYKRSRTWEPMLRLVSAHKPEALRESRMSVAKELAGEGALRAAERYWVDAGEWETACTAYRTAGQWEDALRVARLHGPQGAASRLAYAQALALGPEAGMALLTRLGMVDVALDYACEQGAWDQAIAMAARAGGDKKQMVHCKRGMALEDAGDFAGAEVQFIAAERPREAIEMHLHNRDWSAALRIAENFDPASIPDVLVGHGNAAVQAQDMASAEQLFLDARRPDLAVEAFLAVKAWADALRVAKRHLPGKVAELQVRVKRAMDFGHDQSGFDNGTMPSAASPDRRPRVQQAPAVASPSKSGPRPTATFTPNASDPLSTARSMEAAAEYGLAIDAYMAVLPGPYDIRTCQSAWMTAVRLTSAHDRQRFRAVSDSVGVRLVDLGMHEAAGDMWRDCEFYERAASAYVSASSWQKARSAAANAPPSARIREEVEAAYKGALLESGDPESLVAAGQLDAAIVVYTAQNAWDKVLDTASRGGPVMLAKHLYPHVESVLQGSGDTGQRWSRAVAAVSLLTKYAAPPLVAHIGMFAGIVGALWSGQLGSSAPVSAFVEARDILYKFSGGLRKQGADAGSLAELDRLLLGVHYAAMRAKTQEIGNTELVARLSLSLLRCVGPLFPAERLFYEAGCAARDAGWKPAAVVLFNRFIDLSEAMEDGARTGKGLDNGDFAGTGIPAPSDMPLGATAFVTAKLREQTKDWVLTITMDARAEQSLPKRPCLACSEPVFEAGLGCPACKAAFPACIVSGYPIPASQMVTCSACNSKASKSAWNVVVGRSKACPWCATTATPVL